jgi:hypothetical protein
LQESCQGFQKDADSLPAARFFIMRKKGRKRKKPEEAGFSERAP